MALSSIVSTCGVKGILSCTIGRLASLLLILSAEELETSITCPCFRFFRPSAMCLCFLDLEWFISAVIPAASKLKVLVHHVQTASISLSFFTYSPNLSLLASSLYAHAGCQLVFPMVAGPVSPYPIQSENIDFSLIPSISNEK